MSTTLCALAVGLCLSACGGGHEGEGIAPGARLNGLAPCDANVIVCGDLSDWPAPQCQSGRAAWRACGACYACASECGTCCDVTAVCE